MKYNRKRYQELKDEHSKHHFEGIDYVFGRDQLKEYFERTGYTQADIDSGKLVGDGFGGIGTREAFKARDEYFNKWRERVIAECKPDDIFADEFWNHECGYTGDYNVALNITKSYFSNYKLNVALVRQLQKEFNKLNC